MNPVVRRLRLYRNRLVWLIFGVATVIVAVLGRLVHPHGYVGNRFLAACIPFVPRLLGVRLILEGREHLSDGQRYVFMANHRSIFDNIVMACVAGDARIAGTSRWCEKPVIGVILRALDVISIEQTNTVLGIQRFRSDAKARLTDENRHRGRGLIIFPEGHRSPGPGVLPFHAGGAVAAIDAGVPIVPVAIRGTESVLPLFLIPDEYPSTVRVTILTPIPTVGFSASERHTLTEQAREAISGQLLGAIRTAEPMERAHDGS